MNYLEVYTSYTLFLAAMIISTLMFSALFNAYIIVKVRKTVLFWGYVMIQAMFGIWLSGKLLAVVAPTRQIMIVLEHLQQMASFILIPAFLVFLWGIVKTGSGGRLILGLTVLWGLLVIGIACSYWLTAGIVVNFIPIFSFFIFNLYVVQQRRRIFVELSEVSLDVFMESLEDAVVIFDSSGKIADYNHPVNRIVGRIEEVRTIEDFCEKINERIVWGKKPASAAKALPEQAEIGLEDSGGRRYYLYTRTLSVNKKNSQPATVWVFHDVTEKTILLRELEKKNTELDRMNIRLKNYLEIAGRLEEEKEKSKVFMQIQETIGLSITELLAEMQNLRDSQTEDDVMVNARLSEIINKCRTIMSEIRLSVEKLMPQQEERK